MVESIEKINAEISKRFSSYPNDEKYLKCFYEKNRNADFTLDNRKSLEVVLREAKPSSSQIFKNDGDAIFWGKFKFMNIFLKYQGRQMSYFPETGRWVSGSTNPDCIRDENHITP